MKDLRYFTDAAPLAFDVTVLSNLTSTDERVAVYRMSPGEVEYRRKRTQMAWPRSVYSLSHIAVPFRPDDPVYGVAGTAIGVA